MIIDCISDLHGYHPKLEGGDLLIVAGDLTGRDTKQEHESFCSWLGLQDHYRKKIVIAGNHDNGWIGIKPTKGKDPINPNYEWFEYLCDSGTEFEGLKIWGSPWTKKFEGQNPKAMAFCLDTDDQMNEKWGMIPGDTDILITHGPPYRILDGFRKEDGRYLHAGCKELRDRCKSLNLSLHVFGHIHEWGGNLLDRVTTKFVNCSHVNARYRPVNKPIRIEI